MHYIFHVRNWNLTYFLNLEDELDKQNSANSFSYYAMTKDCYVQLASKQKEVYYLPDELDLVAINKATVSEWDSKMRQKFGYSFGFLFGMERFKPSSEHTERFIDAHIQWFADNIPDNSKMIALTCDHFVYFASSYVNRLKGGVSYFVQPTGFPKEAQVITKSILELFPFSEKELDYSHLQEYIDSLEKSPMESIHYMKEVKKNSLLSSVKERFLWLKIKRNKGIFSYLEVKKRNIIPARFKQERSIGFSINYLDMNNIDQLKEKGKTFYFPLQFEPEMSILGYSPYFRDQLEIIRLICQSLKRNDSLVLKENPKMIGRRSKEFYREISLNNQVFWANPTLNSREIIKKSFKTISVTGTATIEAACLGINSLIFGYPPFSTLLKQKPISEISLTNFSAVLYLEFTSQEIKEHVELQWKEFSKCVHFGNYIPRYINNQMTLSDPIGLAKKFAENVLIDKK